MVKFRVVLILLFLTCGFGVKAVFESSSSVSSKSDSFQTKILSYKFLKAEEVDQLVKKIYPDVRFAIDEVRKKIYLQGNTNNLNKVAEFIKDMDKNRVMIMLETYLIEVNTSDLQTMGVDWNSYKEGLNVYELMDKQKLFESLIILQGQGRAKVLARPSIMCLEQEQAIIRIGDRIPYSVPVYNGGEQISWELRYIDSGADLNIKVKIVSNNIVDSEIKVKFSSIKQWKSTMSGEYPILSDRMVEMICQIPDQQSCLIGGLNSSNERINVTQLPILGDIPLLGELFKKRTVEIENTEIMILITPKIIRL